MYEYGLGGTERKLNQGGDTFTEIPMNRTLLVQKLTADDPVSPEMNYDMKTVDDIFNHYKPKLELSMESDDGNSVNEEISFRSLADFTPDGLTKNSPLLKELKHREEGYMKVVKDLKSNKNLQAAVQDPVKKQAFKSAILAMLKELEEPTY